MQAFVDTQTPLEQAVLVGVQLKGIPREEAEESLRELARLADTAGVRVVAEVLHRRSTPHVACYIGQGKAQEIKYLVEELQADVVIVDEELTPGQTRNLQEIVQCKVVDRTGLILDIFAQRARTREAKVQVELAQLQYALPRLTHQWTHLSRLGGGAGGGVKGGVGTRGPGETQLQIDRQLVRGRIHQLRKALERVERHRRTQRKHRENIASVALVGYTNAGKSTLLNALTGETVFVEDKLFATLDPTTRMMNLPSAPRILLTDTVGFIHKLPHQLVASFHATLEEVLEADLLLHVVDASHPRVLPQITSVHEVLDELGASDKPQWMLFNKQDQVSDPSHLNVLQHTYPEGMLISALTGYGLEALKERLTAYFANREVELALTLSYEEGRILDYLYRHGQVLEREYESSTVSVRVRLPETLVGQLETMVRGTQSRIDAQAP